MFLVEPEMTRRIEKKITIQLNVDPPYFMGTVIDMTGWGVIN